MAKELHMMIGGTGIGKSTLANKMSKDTGFSIFSPDEIEESYKDQLEEIDIDNIISDELYKQISSGDSFILDGKSLSISTRTVIINHATKNGFLVYAHNFGQGTEESKQRRLDNPRDMPTIHWKQVFDFDSNHYEAPTLEEGFSEIINY